MLHLNRRSFIASAVAGLAVSATPAFARQAGFFARHKLPMGVQIYTVGDDAKKDIAGTLARLAQGGFETVELAGFHGHTPQQLRAAADAAGLTISGIHLNDQQLGSTQQDAAKIAADCAVLGVRNVTMPLFILPGDIARREGETFPVWLSRAVAEKGVDNWHKTAALLNARGAALKAEGLSLGYHNHNFEFAPVGGTTGWDILTKETDPELVFLEIDAGWVAAAGVDPVALVKRHAGRVRQMHVKDIKASTKPNFAFQQDPTEVGSGTIDWPALLPAAYHAGVRHFYVEQEPPFITDRYASLAKSAAYLKAQR